MLGALREEFPRIFLYTLAGTLLGLIWDAGAVGACAGLAVLLLLYLRNLAALRAWAQAHKQHELPEGSGVWGDTFDRLIDWQRRNKRNKSRLTTMLAEFRASTAALPDGAVVLGESGEIFWYNRAAQTLLGLRPEDVGLRVANLIRYPAFSEYFGDGDASQKVASEQQLEVPSPVANSRTLSLRIIPYGSNQRLLIVRDVSELKRLETARRDFVSNASHELRTPLTVLRGYLEMLEPEAQHGPLQNWRGPIVEMRNQAARMESLVGDMLRLARLEAEAPLRLDVIDVPMILRRVLEDARAMSQNQHRFEAHIEPGLCLYGAEIETQSIFSNLVSNAVRYTPVGGVIRLEWKSLGGQGAVFSCADSGIGIAEKDIPRLTERFYRVDVGRSRASGGTGLGLSIVKHALERHDANLQITSELGVGSTFICRFPAHRVQQSSTTETRGAEAK